MSFTDVRVQVPPRAPKFPPAFPVGPLWGLTSYLYARVVELADSLDSGSSVLYGRAGSSPASRTKKKDRLLPVFLLACGVKNLPFTGAPARIQRSSSRGERSRSGAAELSPSSGSEKCAACGDAVPPHAPKKRDIRRMSLFFAYGGVKNRGI